MAKDSGGWPNKEILTFLSKIMCFSLLKIIHIGHLKALFQCFMELSSIGSRIKLTDYYNLRGSFPGERRPY